jgi:two-component system copper resistance phosphate regulon response regulator CusR
MRLLLLEDDQRLRAAYARRLEADGGDVDEVGTLAAAQRALALAPFDCLVLDRLVPDGDAVSLVREIDEWSDRPPVLLISALGDVAERVGALTIGADDYLVKPIHLDELALRVRRLIQAAPRSSGVVDLGRVRLDRHLRNVTRDGTWVHLTPTQFKVLEQLAVNVGSVVTTEELFDRCWDAHAGFKRSIVHPHIWKLRKVFDDCLRINSSRGRGYSLVVADR